MKKISRCFVFLFLGFFLYGCKSVDYNKKKKDVVDEVIKDINPNSYFKIIGTEPFWNIEIAEDKIIYAPADGQKIEFAYNIPVVNKNTDTRIYNTVNGKGSITIKLYKGFCTDGMSDRDYDYKADVTITQLKKTTKLKGCGYFVADEILSGNWMLKQINGSKIMSDEELVIPFLEFDIENNRVSGNSGCNGLSAEFTLLKNEIKFNDIILTRMFCGEENIENEFISSLKEINTFKVDGNILKFYKNGYLELLFEKK